MESGAGDVSQAPQSNSITRDAVNVIETADPRSKALQASELAIRWQSSGQAIEIGTYRPPDRPARPEEPALLHPNQMPKRRTGGATGRIALLHAVAHIELNAIDLALDLIARFAPDMGDQTAHFVDDWLKVASEESKHFMLLETCLSERGAAYGDLPAHDGLWEIALETRFDLLARLALVPMVLEARGLDVTPAMIQKMEKAGDRPAAEALQTIYMDEIGHVEIGTRWFQRLCEAKNIEPVETFKGMVNKYFKGNLKPPFNEAARSRAGLLPQFYQNSID